MITFRDSGPGRPPGILIVDPDPQSRAQLAAGLEKQGWAVWTTPDGAAAFDIYELYRERIDVVLVDLQLPGLQGGHVLTELAAQNPDLVRCAMLAAVSPYAASAFRRMSDTPLFTKPVVTRALAFTLHEMIVPVGKH
jgi:DNA-binding response OmpR family regulator